MREEMRAQLAYREKQDKDDDDREETAPVPEVEQSQMQRCRFVNKRFVVVGYALTSKKIKSFLQPKLEGLARNKGISFVAIDPSRPLSEQGPFDIVLHKLSAREWRQILEDYRETHPEVTVLDPPDAIQPLHNRQSMLQAVADMDLSDTYELVISIGLLNLFGNIQAYDYKFFDKPFFQVT